MTTAPPDAGNRAWRTFLQGLGFTLAAALVVSLLTALGTATSWAELGGILVGFAFFQAIATSVLAWVMRTFLDGHLTRPPVDDRGATTLQHAASVVAILAMLLIAAGTATLLR